MSQIQTRDEEGELRYFDSVEDAFNYAKENTSVWKVSWNHNGGNVRFIRHADDFTAWVFESADEIVRNAMERSDGNR